MQKSFGVFRVMAAACIAVSMAFSEPEQIGTSDTYWELADGTLTISGTGDMPNFNAGNTPWWYSVNADITTVIIEDGVMSIGAYAFFYCAGLLEITIPNSVASIEQGAFQLCTGLTAVTIPNSVTSIGQDAFKGCTGLTTITIPNSVASIGDMVFLECTGLTEINIDEGNENYASVDGVVFNKAKTTIMLCPVGKAGAYTIPESVTTIGVGAFKGCTGLTTITIHNSVTSIGTQAFNGCTGLTTITIPNSVTTIGYYVFDGCTGLKQVVNMAATPKTITAYVFEGLTVADVNLVVAASAVDAYKAADVWKDFNVTEITFALKDAEAITLALGAEKTLAPEFYEEYTGAKTITWTSSNATGISVDADGKIKGLTAGAAIITATAPNGAVYPYSVSVAKGKITIPTAAANLVYTSSEQSAGIAENANYTITGDVKGTNANTYTATVALKDKTNYEWADGTTAALTFEWAIAKAKIPNPTAAANLAYTSSEQSAGIAENANYTITGDVKGTNANTYTATVALKDKTNYEWADGTDENLTLTWTIAKASPSAPTGLTAKIGQTLAEVVLPTGWAWVNGDTVIAAPVGEQKHKANFTPTDAANYNVLTDVEVKVAVAAGTPINNIQKSDGRVGVRLYKTIVSDKAEFEVVLPNDKVLEVKVAIYDNTGNVVFEASGRDAKLSWNLTNAAGRNVANGGYLIIAEAKGVKGAYAYSAKVGVKR